MKFRNLLFIALIGVVAVSCDLIEDAAIIDVDTNLKVEVEMQEDEAELGLKSAMYSFTDQGELSLIENEDLEAFVDGISTMKVTDPVATVTGLAEGDVVESILVKISIGDKSFELLSASNINSDSEQTLTRVQDVMNEWTDDYHKVLTVTVSGTRNFTTIGHAPVTTNLVLPTQVSYSPLDLDL